MKLKTKIGLSNVLMFVIPILCIIAVAVIVSVIFSGALGKTVSDLLGNNQSATATRSQIHYYAVQCGELEQEEGEKAFEQLVAQTLSQDNYRYELRKNEAYLYSNLDILDVNFISQSREYMNQEDSFIFTGEQEALIKHVEMVGDTLYELVAVNQNYLENAIYSPAENVNSLSGEQLALILVIVALGALIVVLTATISTRVLARSILGPLNKLTVASRRIQDGDLNFRITASGKDELANLCRDFDEMRRRLKQSIETQMAYEQEQKDLMAGMAHDIRTPITTIKGYIEGLRDGVANTPQKQKRYLDTLAQKTEELNRLVDSLFLFSKLDTGAYPFHFEPVDIGAYLKDYLRSREYDCRRQGLFLHFENRLPRPVLVRLSLPEMERVFGNIISNSVKYKPRETGNLAVSLQAGEDCVLLRFADDGSGVPEESLERLFQRFYRADPARNNPSQGSGLGLSIAQRIVETHGGTISAQNQEGLAITISLPVRPEDQKSLPENARPGAK